MIEYNVKIYNQTIKENIKQENIHTFDIHNFITPETKDFGLILIEKHTKQDDKTQIQPVLALFDKTKWQYDKTKYGNGIITNFKCANNIITLKYDCRIKQCNNQDDLITKFEKVQKNSYFMDKDLPLYEDYLKRKYNK